MKIIGLFAGLVTALFAVSGCQTAPETPLLQAGDAALVSGSVVFGGIDGHLYVAMAGSEGLIRLTGENADGSPRHRYTAYAWAGSKVVYAGQDQTGAGEPRASLFQVIPGRVPVRILREPGAAPFFLYPTPDASRVAYLGPDSEQTGYILRSIGVNGRGEVIHGRGQPFYSAWSPDSSQLLTHVGLPGPAFGSYLQFQSVAALIAGRSGEPPLGLPPGPFQAPAFSPGGEAVAVVLTRNRTNSVFLISNDTESVARVRDLEGAAALAWSPDGSRLALIDGRYSASGGVVGKLWVTTVGDNRVRLVSERATAFFWSPDNSRILYFEPYFVGEGRGAALLYQVRVYRAFDGRSETLGTMRPAAAFVQQIMPFFDQYHRAYTIWSPDSTLVALNTVADNGEPVIQLVDTEVRRSGDAFSVRFERTRMPGLTAAQTADSGFVPSAGVTARVLATGTVPFFNSPVTVRPGTVSSRRGTDPPAG